MYECPTVWSVYLQHSFSPAILISNFQQLPSSRIKAGAHGTAGTVLGTLSKTALIRRKQSILAVQVCWLEYSLEVHKRARFEGGFRIYVVGVTEVSRVWFSFFEKLPSPTRYSLQTLARRIVQSDFSILDYLAKIAKLWFSYAHAPQKRCFNRF